MKKIFAAIFAIVLIFGLSIFAFAYSENDFESSNEIIEKTIVYVNPIYADVVSEDDLPGAEELENIPTPFSSKAKVYYTELEEAGAVLRKQIVNRAEYATVCFETAESDYKKVAKDLFNAALVHTGVSNEGDYLKWNYGGYRAGISFSPTGEKFNYEFTYMVEYYTSAEQEEILAEEIDELIASLNVTGKDHFDKIMAVHDYIRDNVEYDYYHLNYPNYMLQYTAYAALLNKTAVCQGYANLFYRIMLELGIDTRIISGRSGNEPHGWNIVRLDDKYYDLDSTWDSTTNSDRYCLLCEAHFDDHVRDPEYDTAEFKEEYPVSEYCHALEKSEHFIAGGWCGDEGFQGKNLNWHIDKNGVLTIFGTGKMKDYEFGKAPWYEYRKQITALVLNEGITKIGAYSFMQSEIANDLVIPESVTEIGKYAFFSCNRMKGEVVIPAGVTVIEESTFEECRSLDGLSFAGNIVSIGDEAFYGCGASEIRLVFPESLEKIGKKAFYAVNGIDKFVFLGEPPEVYSADSKDYSFVSSQDTIYYMFGKEGWDPSATTWNGYNLKMLEYGYCGAEGNGTNLSWKVEKGVLTISGTGKMADYVRRVSDGTYITAAPWGYFIKDIKSIVIEEGVTHIGNMAFYGCETETLTIPKSVETIGKYAFYQCTGFDGKLVIPENVVSIGQSAFEKISTKAIAFNGNAPTVFAATSSDRSFDADAVISYYPDKTGWTIDTNKKWNGYSIAAIGGPGDVTGGSNIVASGFCGAEGDGKNLEWSIDKDGVLTIEGTGAMADYGIKYSNGGAINNAPWRDYANEVKKLVLTEGIERIGHYAFYGCSFEGNLVLPESLEEIGSAAFQYCRNFTGDIIIPDGVVSMGSSVFSGCSGFNGKLVIGSGIDSISSYAFKECSGLTGDIVIGDNVKKIKEYAFQDCTGFNGTLTIGKNIESIGKQAFYGCKNLTGELVFAETLTSIENGSFLDCGINSYRFLGNAPSVVRYGLSYCSFEPTKDVIHYNGFASGWTLDTNGKWNGYTAVAYYDYGDLNGDGSINVADVYIVRLIAAKIYTPTEAEKNLADVDGDGKITAIDANLIRKFAIKMISEFPVQKAE